MGCWGNPISYLLNFWYIYTKILPLKYQPTIVFFFCRYTNPTWELYGIWINSVPCHGDFLVKFLLPLWTPKSGHLASTGVSRWRSHGDENREFHPGLKWSEVRPKNGENIENTKWGCNCLHLDTLKEIWWSRIVQMFFLGFIKD